MDKIEKVSINLNGTNTEVMNLVPTLEGELAIVNLSVIQRLARLLPSANFRDISLSMVLAIEKTESMKEYVALLEDELAFHTTVNLITTIGKEDVQPEPRVASKMNLDDDDSSCLD